MSVRLYPGHWGVWAVAGLVLCTAALAFVIGRATESGDAGEPTVATAADTGFSRDMAAHHQQAVEMSFLVRDNTTDDEVRRLAFDVINTQANQRGMMLGWLDMWEAPKVTGEGAMSWMAGHSAGSGMGQTEMPGMATRAQLEQLRKAEGRAAEVLYLQLMIPHHQGGVKMAEAAVKQAKNPQVRALAEGIVRAQQSEISLMRDMLAQRGAKPVVAASPSPGHH
ncbi:DUF305 domain-containing protein [Streptomyces sp. P9(2023)]|uniref:DUF305 domain-containing protein n=1 Tax=Streptomyces sp. P9(2023) TaxID=3064394 RepID=UPI0028F411D8|nr:DUF305 domain-containing protein [Streptomyces sp. P9(2023)]MDT9687401.1 DUF305 domain-containing protein [Streptomyces sp. P9(2023)]